MRRALSVGIYGEAAAALAGISVNCARAEHASTSAAAARIGGFMAYPTSASSPAAILRHRSRKVSVQACARADMGHPLDIQLGYDTKLLILLASPTGREATHHLNHCGAEIC